MRPERRLSPFARALRIFSAASFSMFIISLVLITSSREFSQRQKRSQDIVSVSRIALAETTDLRASHRTLTNNESQARKLGRPAQPINVETTNLTVILEHLEVNRGNSSAVWMYTHGKSPFDQQANGSGAVYANTKFTWNGEGRGNGSCSSGGSGKVSRGYLDPFNYFLGLQTHPNFRSIRVELQNLSLSDFSHINVVRPGAAWNVMGEAGDSRRYNSGVFRIFEGEEMLLSSKNVQWVQNLSYPGPIGEARVGSLAVSGYFVAEIQPLRSDKNWVRQLDPNGIGFVLGVITAASFAPVACFASNSYWISLRGFPNFSREHPASTSAGFITGDRKVGAKVGDYKGSSEQDITTARTLAGVAKGVVLTVVSAVVAPTLACVSVAVVAPGATSGPPGQGLVRLLGTVAFVAKVNEIHGFHSDAMTEFASGLRIFIGKVDWPWAGKPFHQNRSRLLEHTLRTGQLMLSNITGTLPDETMRQNEQQTATVTDELFGNCAFYTTLIVVGFLLLHGCIWLAMRKRSLEQQLAPHAWMIYLFSIIMSHVYRAAILNSMQYLRSHVGTGTGKVGLYIVAVMQLFLIGVGFTLFFMTVMVLAVRRIRTKDVEWIPRQDIADPRIRRSAFIVGEYKANEGNAFHSLFECYYGSLTGPRLWLAAIELAIVFLDAFCTAVIWNEVACLAILVCVYTLLFAMLLALAPFVDKIEGWLVLVLGLVELVLLIMDFLAALGDYDMAESMEFGAMVLGFVAIGLAVIIAVYCDLIPIVLSLWCAGMKRWRRELVAESKNEQIGSNSAGSDWSELSHLDSETNLSRNAGRNIEEGEQDEQTVCRGIAPNDTRQAREVEDQAVSHEKDGVLDVHIPEDDDKTGKRATSGPVPNEVTERASVASERVDQATIQSGRETSFTRSESREQYSDRFHRAKDEIG